MTRTEEYAVLRVYAEALDAFPLDEARAALQTARKVLPALRNPYVRTELQRLMRQTARYVRHWDALPVGPSILLPPA